MASHDNSINPFAARASNLASKVLPKPSVIPSPDASSNEGCDIDNDIDTSSSEEEEQEKGSDNQRKTNPQPAAAQALLKQADVPTPRPERVQYRAVNGKIVPTPHGWNIHPELTGDLTDLEAESDVESSGSDEPEVIENKSMKQEIAKYNKVKEAKGSFPIVNLSKPVTIHKDGNGSFPIVNLSKPIRIHKVDKPISAIHHMKEQERAFPVVNLSKPVTIHKVALSGSPAQHLHFKDVDKFLDRLSNVISKKGGYNIEMKVDRYDKMVKDLEMKGLKETAMNNNNKKRKQREYDTMPYNRNSLSFFKPPQPSLHPPERELDKQRLHTIKNGLEIFKEWGGIQD